MSGQLRTNFLIHIETIDIIGLLIIIIIIIIILKKDKFNLP